jgi:phosphate transport system permease protein
MDKSNLILLLLIFCVAVYHWGRTRALHLVAKGHQLHSLPTYYGYLVSLWCGLPALMILGVWSSLESFVIMSKVLASLPPDIVPQSADQTSYLIAEIKNSAGSSQSESSDIANAGALYLHLKIVSGWLLTVVVFSLAGVTSWFAALKIVPTYRARNQVERAVTMILIASATVAVFTTIGIVVSVLIESIRFFKIIPLTEFLFGLKWSPQVAIRSDQVGSTGAFGAVPLIAGTALISLVAMVVAVPVGLLSAIYLSEYASPRFRSIAKPLLEILAGIPTVVYGFFAALVVAPFIRDLGTLVGLEVSSESALAAGLVMGIMIIPFVSSLSDDFINAVPQSLRDGAYALGATQSEAIRQVIMPAALPGIVGGVLLAVSRAIGETMIVVMAAGLSANLTANPLQAVTTVTTQIVTLLVGDQEFDSPKTLAAFALGLLLFLLTLGLNIFALHIVRKYREQYE